MFTTLTAFIHYGKETLIAKPDLLSLIIEMCVQALFSSEKGASSEYY